MTKEKPINMVLFCPNCGTQHIDAPEPAVEHDHGAMEFPEWHNPPHKSHLCHDCGHIWRPADVPTNGVQAIKTAGKVDTWPADHNEEVKARPAAQRDAQTGLTPMGFILDAANAGELAAYDYGSAEMQAALTRILDGKDTGAGVCREPWETLRRRVLALVQRDAQTGRAVQMAIDALEALVKLCANTPALQGREYISHGIETHNAIAALRALQNKETDHV